MGDIDPDGTFTASDIPSFVFVAHSSVPEVVSGTEVTVT